MQCRHGNLHRRSSLIDHSRTIGAQSQKVPRIFNAAFRKELQIGEFSRQSCIADLDGTAPVQRKAFGKTSDKFVVHGKKYLSPASRQIEFYAAVRPGAPPDGKRRHSISRTRHLPDRNADNSGHSRRSTPDPPGLPDCRPAGSSESAIRPCAHHNPAENPAPQFRIRDSVPLSFSAIPERQPRQICRD